MVKSMSPHSKMTALSSASLYGFHHYPSSKTLPLREPFCFTLQIRLLLLGICSVEAILRVILHSEMERRGIKPNKLTFPFLLKACASFLGLTAGRQIQVEVLKHGFDSDVYVGNNLIHLYGSCKKTSDARKVFDEMTDRNFVSWNSIMTALVENGKFNLVFECFCEMIGRRFCPDETPMVVLLSACGGNLSLGKLVHSQV
ncbi:unnamed protein product [Arabidopsis halleri]